MSVNEKMTAIADQIRAYTEAADKLGLDQMAQQVKTVYLSGVYDAAYQAGHDVGHAEGYIAGQQAGYDHLVDPAKIIEKTVSGSMICVDDVSEIPHKCTVSVDKDASVRVCGKNLLDKAQIVIGGLTGANGADWNTNTQMRSGYIPVLPQATYTISGNSYVANKIHCYDSDMVWLRMTERKQMFETPEKTAYVRIAFGDGNTVKTATDLAAIKAEPIQLELGYAATAYEPYQVETHTISAGKTMEVDSVCPTMTLYADKDAAITFGYHKSYGAQTEYDRFWEAFQQNGNKTSYDQAFAYGHWNDETFNPKYPLRFEGNNGGRQVFNGAASLTDIKVPIYAKNTRFSNTFSGCSKLKTIPLLHMENVTEFTTAFNGCQSLENITIDGKIQVNIDFSPCTKLTGESITSIVNALDPETTGCALTLSETAVINAFDDTTATQWENLITQKPNWTINLV